MGIDVDMLTARVRLLAPNARRLLVAAPRSDIDSRAVAESLVRGFADERVLARLVTLADLEETSAPQAEQGITVVAGEGILDSAPTLLAAGSVDAVILVARAQRTSRHDLETVRMQLEAAQAHLIGVALV